MPALRKAWVQGYRQVRALSDEDEAKVGTAFILGRVALLPGSTFMSKPPSHKLCPRNLRLAQMNFYSGLH